MFYSVCVLVILLLLLLLAAVVVRMIHVSKLESLSLSRLGSRKNLAKSEALNVQEPQEVENMSLT